MLSNPFNPIQRRLTLGLLLAVGLNWGAVRAPAAVQPITGISVTYGTIVDTNANYSITGGGSAGFPTGTVYNVRFNEGTSNITYLAGVVIGGLPYNAAALAPEINIARATHAPATGTLHIVLYEQSSFSGTNIFLKTSYQPTMEESLRSKAINLGADNVFSDVGDGNGNNNNIQRIDYLFPDGIPVYNRIDQRGFIVMDRGGNDRFKIAAITSLDGNGKPASFGTPVSVMETNWGSMGLSLDTIVMRGYTEGGDRQHPSADVSPQPLSGVYLNLQTLGLRTNDLIYGYSLVGNDTTTNGALWVDVQNPVHFPTNTSPDSTFGGLDLISGGMVFYDAALDATLGNRAWDDLNANGLQDAGEPGLSNVLVHVYDAATNLVATRRTDTNGVWECKDNGPGTFFAKYFLPTNYEFTARYVGTNAAIDSDAHLVSGQTAAIALTNHQTNLTLDAGMYRRAAIGDWTWEDMNGNGQQDPGEPALSNVVVRLYDAASNVIGTTTSSVAGAYAFTNLVPGSYFVGFTPPAGYFFTTSNVGADATDSDPLPGTDRTAAVTLVSGQTNATVDAGFWRPAFLGDYTWEDFDGNGQQDAGELGLSNVVVRLYDAASNVVGVTKSSASWAYGFANLAPGSYFVGFTAPAGYLFTDPDVGDDASDSDASPATGRTAPRTLASGQEDATIDAGFVRSASLGDFTWVDADSNGQQDGGEPGLANVVVRLYDAASNVVGTTTSSVAGAYAFTDLLPGTYVVGFTPPAGYALTFADLGDDATDSDADAVSGFTAPVELASGQAEATVDAGFVQPAAIGNYTWVDANFNGQQDAGEPALANVVVRLYDGDAHLLATTTSSVAGAYAFTNLSAGTYRVGFTPPSGWSFTAPDTGADATDSDPDPATGLTAPVGLVGGQTDLTVDAGFYNPSSVSLKLFKSSSLSGNWNLGETNEYYLTLQNTGTVALAGVALTDLLPPGATFVPGSAQIVHLTATTTNPFAGTVSDGFGTVSYANNDGTDNWLGSWAEVGDGTPGVPTGGSVLVRVAGGTNALVFENSSADNDYVTRTNVLAAAPGRVYTNVTLSFAYRRQNWDRGDSFTFYVSTNGFAGQSNLVFAVPTTAGTDAGYVDVQLSSNLTSVTGFDLALRLRAGGRFGYGDRINVDYVTFAHSGYDVATTPATTYAPGVGVTVVSNLATATPGNLLSNYTLAAGTTVTVRIRATLDAPLVSTQFVNVATATNPATPPLVASVTNVSAANAVGDRVWFDTDGDGIQDGGEPGLTGVTVRLYGADSNLIATTTSGVAGAYAFANLPSGSYFLEFDTPADHLPTAPDQGGNDALDSDADVGTGRTAAFALSGGTNDTSRDAGFHQPTSSIGDFVWRDADVDGLQGGGSETGMPGVVVRLYGAASNLVADTTTSAAGAYSFTDLPPATYFVEFAAPSGYTFTRRNQGTDDAVDSDVAPTTGRTAPFYLPPGKNDTRWDAGLSEVVRGLALAKTSDASSCLAPGDAITYTVTVLNTGNVAQAGVVVADVLPAGLTLVPGSAQVTVSNTVVSTVRDEFSEVAYDNQDGSRNWSVDWQENDPYGTVGPAGNYVGISGGRLMLYYAYVGAETAWRWTDLSAETNATLSFDWETIGLDANEYMDVQIATNPDGPYVQLAQLGGTASGSTNIDVTAYVSTSTTIRVQATPGTENWESGEYGYLDNVEIASLRSTVTTGPAAALPLLVSGQDLAPGGRIAVTFQATVDTPSAVTQLLNVATAYSAVQPAIEAATTNCVVFADVGVAKSVSDPAPGMLETIDYVLVASNNGPDVATGVVLTDVLPPQVQYVGHSNGTYNAGSGEWTIGTLAVGASTTLVLRATVLGDTAGLHVTNVAAVTGRDLFDPVPENDADEAVIVPKGWAAIGDWVWFDGGVKNGIQDASETNGLATLSVDLVNASGEVVASTLTDAEGRYLFTNVVAGTYAVRFDLRRLLIQDYTVSLADQGDDDARDSDVAIGNAGDYASTKLFSIAAGETNRTLDLGVQTRGSTRAEVAETWGEWRDGRGLVTWRTGSEFGTAGFFVYRIDPETGAETRLNDVLLPSAFQESGAVYRLADPEAREGQTGTYRLEEVELTGGIRNLGSQAIEFAPPPPETKVGPLPKAAAPAPRTMPKAAAQPSPVLKVLLAQEGFHGVSLAAIAEGMGLPLENVQALAAANSLRITEQGRPVPTIYDAARGRLVFHAAAPVHTWYVHDAAYLISVGDGLAMARRAPGAAAGTSVFPVQLHFEQDRFLFAMTQMPEDFYFWAGVVSQTNDLLAPRFPLDLSGHAGGDVRLKVRLMGWSSTAADPDHLAEFTFNGTAVGSILFDDQETAEAELTIPGSLVVNGENTLMVNGVLQPGHSHSFFVVDWIEAAFARELAPGAVSATFRANGAVSVSAHAFAEPLALALDAAGSPTWIADENGELPAKAWAVAAADDRFAVAEADAVPLLVPEPAAAEAWFLSPTNRIDYLVIASRALAPAAQELADYRAEQGLRAGVATFEDVCDLLAGGVRTPEAIPELLSYAAATWARPPQMVVLAGNGHYDYLGVNTGEANHLPPLLVQTPSGVCASDARLADVGGDARPDMAIGRLPALTAAELEAMIAKIKAYEADFGAEWQNQLVFVSDKADSAGDFREANSRLAALATGAYSVPEHIELDEQDLAPARARLMNRFKTGTGFIHYTGHGGLHNFSGQNLLTEADVGAMTNAVRPPVAVALSCLVGRYEVPTASSLGEALLRRPQGGAVAVLGPSGLSRNAPATELGEAFYRAILEEGVGRLGLAFLRARRSLPESLFPEDTVEVYNLLGDPALRIAGNSVEPPPLDLAQLFLTDLEQVYDGTGRCPTATTEPEGLAVAFTFDGASELPVLPGAYAVAATIVDAAYEGSATGTLTIAKGTTTLALDGLSQTYDGTPRAVEATTAPAGLAVEWTYDGSPAPPTEAGSYQVVATVVDDNYEGSASGMLVVAKASAAVELGGLAQIYDGTARAPTATTEPAGLAVDFTYDGSAFAPADAGIYAVVAAVNEANFAGSASGWMEIAKADQSIDFPAIGDQRTSSVASLSATASSGLDVRFAVASGPAVLAGTDLSFTGPGVVTVVASQPGDGNWNPAPETTRTFAVLPPLPMPVVNKAQVLVREGGEGRFYVRLDRAPDGDVDVQVRLDGATSPVAIQSAPVLAFKPTNWDVWQAVELAAGEDDNRESETAAVRISVAGLGDQIVEARTLDDDIGQNLALASNGARISGAGGYLLPAMIDGVHTSNTNYGYAVWTRTPPGTITLDLQAAMAVARVRLLNWDWNCRVHQYRIESSVDGTTWSTLVDASSGEHSGWEDWDASGQIARYLRLTGLSNSANSAVCLPEWEVYGVNTLSIPMKDPDLLELSATNLHVREAGEGRFFVRLSRQPAENVEVHVERRSGAETLAVQSGADLVFKPSNWDVWQAVTLAAAEDGNAADETAAFAVAGPDGETRIVEAIALDDDIGENLARGATIAGAGGYLMSRWIDGVHTSSVSYGYTVWTRTPPGSITMDLQTTATVARLRLLNWDWTYRSHQYRIDASPDGINWSLVADARAGDHRGWEDWPLADQAVRYLRFTGLSNSANSAVCISEIEVYPPRPLPENLIVSSPALYVREGGEGRFFVRLASAPESNVVVGVSRLAGDANLTVKSGAALVFKPSNWSNWQTVTLAAAEDANAAGETATFQVALPGAAARRVEATSLDDDVGENLALAANGTTISGSGGYLLPQVIDGVHTSSGNYGYTVWTRTPPGSLTLDLQAETAISQVRLLHWDWSFRVHQYRIESSLNGVDWSILVDAGTGEHGGWENWNVSGASARYLRFTGLSNSANSAVCIAEWEVYGTRVSAVRHLASGHAEKLPETRLAEEPDPSWTEPSIQPDTVLTSDGSEDAAGWLAVDGDPETAWIGRKLGGGYLVLGYESTVEITAVDVELAAGSLANVEILCSLDAETWSPLPDDLESQPVALNYLWVIFPDEGTDAVPRVLEIRPRF